MFWKPCIESSQIPAVRPSVLEATPSPANLPAPLSRGICSRFPTPLGEAPPPSATRLLFPLLGSFPVTRDSAGNAAGAPGEAAPAPRPLPPRPRVPGESETKEKNPSWAAIRPVPRTPTSRARGYRWSSGARRSPPSCGMVAAGGDAAAAALAMAQSAV